MAKDISTHDISIFSDQVLAMFMNSLVMVGASLENTNIYLNDIQNFLSLFSYLFFLEKFYVYSCIHVVLDTSVG